MSQEFSNIGRLDDRRRYCPPANTIRNKDQCKRSVGFRANCRPHGALLRFLLAVICRDDQVRLMANVIYLSPDEEMPDHGDDQRWLTIDASDDGRFFGTGGSFKATGVWVGYGSLAENDGTFETALAAAQQWAAKYDVPTIWVQLKPYGS